MDDVEISAPAEGGGAEDELLFLGRGALPPATPPGAAVEGGAPDDPAPATEPAAVEGGAPDDPAPAPDRFLLPAADPRRGVLWAGAAPMPAGAGRIGLGVGGGWYATWNGVQAAGGGAEVDAAWALSRRVAVTGTFGVAGGTLRTDGALGPARGWGALASARWLVVDAPRARVAPFLAAAVGAGEAHDTPDGPAGTDLADGESLVPREGALTSLVGGGVALEIPFYEVTFDVALPLGGVVVTGAIPETIPLAPGPFVPLFLLTEAGFTWRLGEHTSFRLGYVALATSWSWRWHDGPLTVEVSGHTNLLTGNLSTRVGWVF